MAKGHISRWRVLHGVVAVTVSVAATGAFGGGSPHLTAGAAAGATAVRVAGVRVAGVHAVAVPRADGAGASSAYTRAVRPASPTWRSNPSRSLQPSGDFVRYCFTPGQSVRCDRAALADIDRARRAEGLHRLSLPHGFVRWGVRRQLRVLADRERAVRGLPLLADNGSLDRVAQAGAVAGSDPTGPSGYAWGSNIASGYTTPLAADFAWMYDDGPASTNADCPSAGAPGCWGHRDNILSPWGGAQGAGEYDDRGTLQLTQLFVERY